MTWRSRAPSLAMVAYEYLITFNQEVTFFWRCKMMGTTILFLAARYLALLAYPILGMTTYAYTLDEVQYQHFQTSLVVVRD